MRAGVQEDTSAVIQCHDMKDDEGRHDDMKELDIETVVSSVGRAGTTPETGKHEIHTRNNFTCSAKQDHVLDVAAYGDQPARDVEAGHSVIQTNNSGGDEEESDRGERVNNSETDKHLLRTLENFTCSAKQDPVLDGALCGDQPAHNTEAGHTQIRVATPKVVGHEVFHGDHPSKLRWSIPTSMTPPKGLPLVLGCTTTTPPPVTSTPVSSAGPSHTQNLDLSEVEAGDELGAASLQGTRDKAVPKPCQHVRGGMCLTHGKKANKKLKPSWTNVAGPGGELAKKLVKKTFWQCDVGHERGVILRQTKLFFPKKTLTDVGGVRDTPGGVSRVSNISDFSSTTLGQEKSGDVQHRKEED